MLLPLLVAATPPGQGRAGGDLPPGTIERTGPDGATAMLLGAPAISGPSDAAPEHIARDFVERHRDRFDLTPRQLDQLVVRNSYRTAHNDAHHVTLGQDIAGHRVAGTGLTFTIDADGRIIAVGGPLARGAATGQGRLTALEAIRSAGGAAGVDVPEALPERGPRGDQHRFTNTFASTKGPNPVTAEAVWYPSDDGSTLTLAWETDFEVDADTWLHSFVAARDGELLHQENRYVHAQPQGTVFTGQHPEDSGPRAVVPFTGIGGSWVDDRVTSGNNVNAYRDLDNSNTVGYRPETPASGDPDHQHFDYAWTDAWATQADGSDASLDADLDAIITQLFYYTNVMHDWLYDLGFDEASGNFQVDNFGKGGAGGDPVLAEAQDGWDFGCQDNSTTPPTPIRCRNNARFATPADGASPRMRMFMWSPWRPYRDGSMDGDVIAHEYGHGVSSRLVGGGDLGYGSHLVHASLGEGWSDVISFLKWEDTTVAEYVTGNAATGIRSVAYDTSTLTYSDYNPNAGSGHPNGEVWATMVYDIREALGVDATAQLVVDGMKSTPPKPNFMDARDGIITADGAAGGDNYCLLWRIFADNGLGTGATFSKSSTSAPADDDGVPPECVPTADANGPYTTDEGTDVGLDGSASTPSSHSSGGPISYAWDLDDDGDFDDATGPLPTFDTVGDDLVRTVGLRVTNAAGISDEATSTVTVTNVAPTTSVDAVAPTSENVGITLAGGATDPGWLDTLSATVDWDDGAGPQPLSGATENVRPDAEMAFSVGHVYGDDGTYTVEVCVDDDDGGSDCASTSVVVGNTNPTAAIDEDAYWVHAGDSLAVSANSTDPGSDDLEATWDWGDGADTVTGDLVNPPATDPTRSPSIQPRDVDWDAAHVYADACLYTLGLDVVDDDGGSASDTASVVVTGNADRLFGSGYWMAQYRDRPPNQFTTERLECYLAITSFMSDVFDEERAPLATRSDAVDVLFVKQNGGSESELFDEQLLAAWVNFANGGADMDTLVDTDGDEVADTTFGSAITTAEAVRLDPTATRDEVLEQKDILEVIVTSDG